MPYACIRRQCFLLTRQTVPATRSKQEQPSCKTQMPSQTRIRIEPVFSAILFSILFGAIHFIVTVEMPLYLGETDLSAKWRRSRKHLRWLDLPDLEKPSGKSPSKILRIEPLRNARTTHPQSYRLPRNFGKRIWKPPKPLIDIFQEKNWITIVAEIAGFNKETLKIDVKDQKLTLSAKAKDRRYYKSLNLPKVVIPNVVSTTFKNGVLEIKLKKAEKEQTIKKKAG
jgi:HSP20 family molecular chaperone IbpA